MALRPNPFAPAGHALSPLTLPWTGPRRTRAVRPATPGRPSVGECTLVAGLPRRCLRPERHAASSRPPSGIDRALPISITAPRTPPQSGFPRGMAFSPQLREAVASTTGVAGLAGSRSPRCGSSSIHARPAGRDLVPASARTPTASQFTAARVPTTAAGGAPRRPAPARTLPAYCACRKGTDGRSTKRGGDRAPQQTDAGGFSRLRAAGARQRLRLGAPTPGREAARVRRPFLDLPELRRRPPLTAEALSPSVRISCSDSAPSKRAGANDRRTYAKFQPAISVAREM